MCEYFILILKTFISLTVIVDFGNDYILCANIRQLNLVSNEQKIRRREEKSNEEKSNVFVAQH